MEILAFDSGLDFYKAADRTLLITLNSFPGAANDSLIPEGPTPHIHRSVQYPTLAALRVSNGLTPVNFKSDRLIEVSP